MHERKGLTYTKHRHKQLQSHLSSFLHNMLTHPLWLMDEETGRKAVSQWVRGVTMWGQGPTDSEVINESELGAVWWNTTGQMEFIILSIFITQASVVTVKLLRLMDRISWSGERSWAHGICLRNVNVWGFLFLFFFPLCFFLSQV